MEELITILGDDSEYFDCVAEIEHARTIISRGTSSHQQLETYRQAIDSGATHEEALTRVVDWLIEATVAGV